MSAIRIWQDVNHQGRMWPLSQRQRPEAHLERTFSDCHTDKVLEEFSSFIAMLGSVQLMTPDGFVEKEPFHFVVTLRLKKALAALICPALQKHAVENIQALMCQR